MNSAKNKVFYACVYLISVRMQLAFSNFTIQPLALVKTFSFLLLPLSAIYCVPIILFQRIRVKSYSICWFFINWGEHIPLTPLSGPKSKLLLENIGYCPLLFGFRTLKLLLPNWVEGCVCKEKKAFKECDRFILFYFYSIITLNH